MSAGRETDIVAARHVGITTQDTTVATTRTSRVARGRLGDGQD